MQTQCVKNKLQPIIQKHVDPLLRAIIFRMTLLASNVVVEEFCPILNYSVA